MTDSIDKVVRGQCLCHSKPHIKGVGACIHSGWYPGLRYDDLAPYNDKTIEEWITKRPLVQVQVVNDVRLFWKPNQQKWMPVEEYVKAIRDGLRYKGVMGDGRHTEAMNRMGL